MPKLRLAAIEDDRPVKLSVELAAVVHRDLVAYAKVLGHETGQDQIEPAKLIGPMLARFMATDRAFTKLRHRNSAVTQTTRQGGPKSDEVS